MANADIAEESIDAPQRHQLVGQVGARVHVGAQVEQLLLFGVGEGQACQTGGLV